MRSHPGALYLNIEDTRLFGMEPADFPALIDVIEEFAGSHAVFLDEIQQLPEWPRLVRTLMDRGHTLCVTGSNASLLGREVGAKLTGRHTSFEVFPFSYSEFLEFKGGRRTAQTLSAYLEQGGFPGYLREDDPNLLRQLLRDIVDRDITQRHHLRESRHVMNLALFLFANTGQKLSFQSITKALAIPTVHQTSRYLEFLEDSYLLFALPKFSTSFKKRVVAPNKYYAVDNGLRRANSPNLTPDAGHRLENAVFLSLRARGVKPCYASEKDLWECDFVTDDLAIQVCAHLTPSNLERELEGVRRALELPGKRRGLIITLDQADSLDLGESKVEVVPAWKWLD
jgi:predicted AAA+ superfamily ATPase